MKPSQQNEQRTAHGRREAQHAVLRLAQTIRALRRAAGLNLQELARLSGLATSTLSKIENHQISPTFDTLVAIARGLDVDLGTLVSPVQSVNKSGRRAVVRDGQGTKHETPVYDYAFLCTEISNKKFIPLLTTIKAHEIEAFPALSTHDGEEFFYVLTGQVMLHTDMYEPTLLNPGDCIYFDSTMGHALVAAGQEETKVLWISSSADRARTGGPGSNRDPK